MLAAGVPDPNPDPVFKNEVGSGSGLQDIVRSGSGFQNMVRSGSIFQYLVGSRSWIKLFSQFLLTKVIIHYYNINYPDLHVESKKKANFISQKLGRIWIRYFFEVRIRIRFFPKGWTGSGFSRRSDPDPDKIQPDLQPCLRPWII